MVDMNIRSMGPISEVDRVNITNRIIRENKLLYILHINVYYRNNMREYKLCCIAYILCVLSLSGIVLRHTGVDSEHVTGGFRARRNCERVINICVLKSFILVISVGNYRNKCHITVQKTMDKCRKTLHEI